jgi:hypothetical protein
VSVPAFEAEGSRRPLVIASASVRCTAPLLSVATLSALGASDSLQDLMLVRPPHCRASSSAC